MSNRDLAKHIARGIFAVGDDGAGYLVHRIAFKHLRRKNDEVEGGGLCEAALVSVIERLLARRSPATGEKS